MHRYLWALVLPSAAVAADVEFVHQGRLIDATGVATSGSIDLTVSLWTDVADTNLALRKWTDTFTGVSVSDGYFTIVLGSQDALPASVLSNPALYIETQVGTSSPLVPRQYVFGVPQAQVTQGLISIPTPASSCDTEGLLRYDQTQAAVLVCNGSEWLVLRPEGRLRGLSLVSQAYEFDDGTYAASCRAYFDHPDYNGEGDGMYRIDPDGPGGDSSRMAYCDMTTAPGGWTLAHHGFNANPAPHGQRFTNVYESVVVDPLVKADPINLVSLGAYGLIRNADVLRFVYHDLSGVLSNAQGHQEVQAEGNFSTLFNNPGSNNYVSVVSRELTGAQRVRTSGARVYWGTCATYLTALRFETFRDQSYYQSSTQGNCHTDTYGNGNTTVTDLDFADFTDGNGGGIGTIGASGWGVGATSHVYNLWVR